MKPVTHHVTAQIRLKVECKFDPTSNTWTGQCVEIPGVIKQGRNVLECKSNTREAAEGVILWAIQNLKI